MQETGHSVTDRSRDVSESFSGEEIRLAGPLTAVLSNGALTSAISANGSTRLSFDGLAVNRGDAYEIRIRDVDTGRSWSAMPDPVPADAQCVLFDAGRIAFERREQDVLSVMDVFVDEEEDAELRRLVLRNTGDKRRRLDVTSYLEIVLNEARADDAHPAFSKLFVQTEFKPETNEIRAWRRLRSPDEQPVFFSHVMAGDGRTSGFETSRPDFIGRGRSGHAPAGMDAGAELGGNSGSVLDPVAVLRREVELEPGEEARLLIVVAAGRDSASLDGTIARITAPSFEYIDAMRAAAAREVERMLMLDITPDRLHYIRRFTGAVLVDVDDVRAPADMLARVTAPVDRLAAYGLDPYRPIVVVRAAEESDVRLVRFAVRTHSYWTSLGLSVDVVIFNDRSETEAAEELQVLIERTAAEADALRHVGGGIQMIYSDDVPREDQLLIQSCASVIVREQMPEFRPRPVGVPPSDKPIARPAASANVLPARPRPDLSFDNGYGGFTEDGREYAIIIDTDDDGRHQLPPQPWTNVIANEQIGFIVSETGAGSTWSGNSREFRLTPWSNDPVLDPHSEAIYIRDEDAGWYWSPTPGPAPAPASYHVFHGAGYTRFETSFEGLTQTVLQCVHRDKALKLTRVRIANTGDRPRRLSLFAVHDLVLGGDWSQRRRLASFEFDRRADCVLARNRASNDYGDVVVCSTVRAAEGEVTHSTNKKEFFGAGGAARPAAIEHQRELQTEPAGRDGAAIHQVRLEVPPGGSVEVDVLLGAAADLRDGRAMLRDVESAEARDAVVADAMRAWDELLGSIQIATPSAAIDLMVNRWLPYQNLSCRIHGRSAFYQSGGAFGYRDQLQDAAALLYLDPAITRRQILLHAAHQFVEGDVLHWWHPPSSKGIRTRFSDDLLWLPLVTAHYVQATGDHGILEEEVPFLQARALEPGEDEAFVHPEDSGETGSVFEHCCRAIDRSLTRGAHGLPLMGTGDWNDGMNRVGREGRGESVWLGFFLHTILEQFIPICGRNGDQKRENSYREYLAQLRDALEEAGWDGAWYRRAYYDNGDVLGSSESDEAQIDALVQAWSVISGAAPPDRAQAALDAMEERLVDEEAGIIRLLTPAFDRTRNDPGYIKGYVPGVRENGGQYTHAALWAVQALAMAGRGERAARLLEMLSPISHARTREAADRYRVEPYVIAADVYGEPPHVGRGGWTWYTGSAGWMYRVAIESIIGFGIEGGTTIKIDPRVPASWSGFSIHYRVPGEETSYRIHIENRDGRTSGIRSGSFDGGEPEIQGGIARIPLRRDGKAHRVDLQM